MKIRRSFFICLAVGFLLPTTAYFGLFYLQLGVPTPKWGWLSEIVEMKIKIARAITRPKLLIVAGSSALYGISAEEIERQTGYPTVNFGTNAGLGPAITLHLTRKVCLPGDTVLLAFEYELYLGEDLAHGTADEVLMNYILGHDRDYVLSLSLYTQGKLALMTPRDRFWSGLRAVFQKPVQDPIAVAGIRELVSTINSHGDQTHAVPERRLAQNERRRLVSSIPALGFPPSVPGFQPIREFCTWAKGNNVRVLATFPNICHRPEYDLPAAKQMPAQFRAFFESIGVPVLGDLSESMLPEEEMFDTYYHPLRSAAIRRTQRLLVHLAPHLKMQP